MFREKIYEVPVKALAWSLGIVYILLLPAARAPGRRAYRWVYSAPVSVFAGRGHLPKTDTIV